MLSGLHLIFQYGLLYTQEIRILLHGLTVIKLPPMKTLGSRMKHDIC
ncbi:MAG: hypothetical protein KIG68_08990 [Oxalobacter sp.]|nr:hypothetical protein [Oxalobacter sp.]